jgi:hypothetical protein
MSSPAHPTIRPPAESREVAADPPFDVEPRDEPRSLLVLAAHLVLFRIGWIFKIESVLMPAFLDHLAGPGWMRGMLPVLNRFGQSVAPIWAADAVQGAASKNRILVMGTLSRAALSLLLAGLYFFSGYGGSAWMAWAFLAVYTVFFVCHGVSQLALNTLQGKVLRPIRFGRLMALSDPVGTVSATVIAGILLPIWLGQAGGFISIFLCTGASFALSLGPLLFLREPLEESHSGFSSTPLEWRRPLADAWSVWTEDQNFRRLAVVAMLFSTMQILMPHYQAFGRERLGVGLADLMPCVVAQNLATGCFSLLAGPSADRWGSRTVMRWLNVAAASAPLWALALLWGMDSPLAKAGFFSIFIPMGLMPVGFKTFNNYILEASPRARHSRYLSTLSLFIAVPFLLAPLVGWATEFVGFVPVFALGALLILLSGWLAGGLEEPRYRGHQRLAAR